jgi:hypothetical protein
MQLELSAQEKELLHELADAALRELKSEIRRTSTHEYQDSLKQREAMLQSLIGRLA